MKTGIYRLIITVCLIFIIAGCDSRSKDEKMMHKAMQNVIHSMKAQYGLHYIGRSEGGDLNHYKKIGLNFQIFRITGKDEGRKIIIDATEKLLNEINSNPELLPYLIPSPFTVDNLQINIYALHPDGKVAYYPNITIFTLRNNKILFTSDTLEMKNKYGYYKEDVESYEDASKNSTSSRSNLYKS